MKIVTYNTHYGVGRDGRADLDRVAAAIDGADIVALQEVERFWPRSGMVDQPVQLGKRLPEYWWVYGPNIDLHTPASFPGEAAGVRRQFGNMILARRPLLASENHALPRMSRGERSVRRGALEAIIDTPSGGLRIGSTHLCYLSPATRVAQANELFRRWDVAGLEGGAWHGEHPEDPSWRLGDEPEMPLQSIVLGDFNFGPGDTEYDKTVGVATAPFVDAWPLVRPGEPGATKDGKRIDQAWVTAGLADRVRGAWVDEAASGSDHQPVWFDIDL